MASDGGGSTRAPTRCCGVFGIKPTRGVIRLLRLNGACKDVGHYDRHLNMEDVGRAVLYPE
ncbi:hypothetical protein JYP50_08130 [Parahaliea mediterranea]|uniref:Amidase domain-containing protein n=2 Tax=Parahaliea mediterranea TaxID=651086 RepID=A0A939DEC0_9GAMM|nr:hypothetical protein [Parahaliea mediterranea]